MKIWMVYTHEARAYIGIPRAQGAVKYSAGEYVSGTHTSGMESFWAMMKRGYADICHNLLVIQLPNAPLCAWDLATEPFV